MVEEAGESRGPLKESTSSGAASSPSPPTNTITTHSRMGCRKAPSVGHHYDGEDGHIKGGVSPDSNHRFPGENSPFPPINAINYHILEIRVIIMNYNAGL